MIDSDKELDGVKANVSEKKIELTTLEVKIEMLNRRQKKLGIYIDEENEAYKILEEAIDLKKFELDEMGLRNQENLILEYGRNLEEASFSQRHALLSLISSLQEITFQSVTNKNKAIDESKEDGKFDFETNYDQDTIEQIIEFNALFCDFFKDEVSSAFDENYEQRVHEIIEEKFEDIKENANINFVRWVNKV